MDTWPQCGTIAIYDTNAPNDPMTTLTTTSTSARSNVFPVCCSSVLQCQLSIRFALQAIAFKLQTKFDTSAPNDTTQQNWKPKRKISQMCFTSVSGSRDVGELVSLESQIPSVSLNGFMHFTQWFHSRVHNFFISKSNCKLSQTVSLETNHIPITSSLLKLLCEHSPKLWLFNFQNFDKDQNFKCLKMFCRYP